MYPVAPGMSRDLHSDLVIGDKIAPANSAVTVRINTSYESFLSYIECEGCV